MTAIHRQGAIFRHVNVCKFSLFPSIVTHGSIRRQEWRQGAGKYSFKVLEIRYRHRCSSAETEHPPSAVPARERAKTKGSVPPWASSYFFFFPPLPFLPLPFFLGFLMSSMACLEKCMR